MNVLSVNSLSKSFGARQLFNQINFGIAQGEKVALVAANGSGKSTLFKILKGEDIADEGEVVFRKDLRVAFLDQDIKLDPEKTIEELIHSADNDFVEAIKAYEAAVSENETHFSEGSAKRMEDAMHRMNQLEAWDYEKNLKEILSRLEIRDLSQKSGSLSGGQGKRVALSLVLISQPQLLILDEPTNHLDIEMIEWLEHYLQNSSMSLLLVTHDRYFLDAVCTRILEIDRQQLFEYKGDFEYFLTKKAEREAVFVAEVEKARNLYRRELEWIRKMPKARGTKAKARVDAFSEVEAKARQRLQQQTVELSVKMERLGSKIVELHKVSKSFAERKIIEDFTYVFRQGEKVGLVGKNGVGKSTLIKLILGEQAPDKGKISVGETVVFGHYSQAGMRISDDKRVIEAIRDIAEFIPLANGRSLTASQLLTRFNFPPAVQFTEVGKLSGGEKRRLYLLTVLMKNPNFLLLDEPTNDLDIQTLQTLEEFLEEFRGCVLIASHDRYFIDRLADHVFAMEGDGKIKDYPGTYSDYRQWRQLRPEELSTPAVKSPQPTEPAVDKTIAAKKLSYKIQRELEELEKEIPALEDKKRSLEESLAAAGSDYAKLQELGGELQSLNDKLDEKTMRWMEIQEQSI